MNTIYYKYYKYYHKDHFLDLLLKIIALNLRGLPRISLLLNHSTADSDSCFKVTASCSNLLQVVLPSPK